MKKIKSEFLTRKDANSAIDRISSYCLNAKIINNTNYDYYDYNSYIPEEGYYIPDSSMLNFGGFGITANWNYKIRSLENRYNPAFSRFYQSSYNESDRVTIEADVSDDNFGYVRDILYSSGAITVTQGTYYN